MARRAKTVRGGEGGRPETGATADGRRGRRRPAGWRRWAYPLIVAVAGPALLLGGLEAGLRLAGYGFPPSFLLPLDEGGGGALVTNPRFGWRFFPPAVARAPVVARLAAEKPADTVRLVVLGGSAAMGTPEADFAFGRMLEAMLAEGFPGRRFEVVNAAMAAIDSHVVRTVAGELAARQPDAFLVYLGNNEVVGPYGPGTVFGGFSSSLAAVRAGIWLGATRTGQLARDVAARAGGGPELSRWRGMEMFLDRRVTADDPRLAEVYEHYEANLHAVVDAAHAAGARTYLSTVAVNLVDEPPFASVHGDGVPAAERERFAQRVEDARQRLAEGERERAIAALEEAVAIDPGHAAGRWLLGRVLLAAGRRDEAAAHLAAARDLDALRFRADSGIERAIRRVSEARAADGAVLIDGAAAVAGVERGAPPLAGHEALWEHVHLTPEGNLRLARAFYEALAPDLAGGAPPPPPPAPERVAERLALSAWDVHRMGREILAMVRRPPFVDQLDHAARVAALERTVGELAFAAANGREEAERLDRAVLDARPDDLHVREQLARLLAERGAAAEAAEQWRQLLRRVPGVDEWRTNLAFALADAGQSEEAREIAAALYAERGDADARANLGLMLERAGDPEAAAEHYRAVLADRPEHPAARLNLADLLVRRGELAEAERLLREGLALDDGSARAWAALAAVHEQRGDLEAALPAWSRAVELDPDDARAANNLGYALVRQGRYAEGSEQYLRALRADPGYALAYFNLADLYLMLGRPADAVPLYRRGLALAPGNRQGRENLAQAERLAAGGPPG